MSDVATVDAKAGVGTDLVPTDVPFVPGARPLPRVKHEKYCRLRAMCRPKHDAYRQAFEAQSTDHDAAGNASRLERKTDVQERIIYLARLDNDMLKEKQRRLEEALWAIHEADFGDLWETVTVEKRHKKTGEVVHDADGNVVYKHIVRPRPINQLAGDTRRAIESISISENGYAVPKLYSKLQANAELRKLLGIGVMARDEDAALARLSDAELVAELARQARELGIEVDLTYRFGG